MSVWSIDERSSPPLWRAPTRPGVVAAFTTRQGGVSVPPYHALNLGRSTADDPMAVETNRVRVLASLGLAPDRLVTAGQVHGATIRVARSPGLERECDAVLTRERGLALAVSAADCLPILLVGADAVAAIHSGWRGTAAGIARATLRALTELAGGGPETVQVFLGPGIRACCYEVGPEVAARFPAHAVTRVDGGLRLSLPDVVIEQLGAAGVPRAMIHDTGACTACEPHWYYSHRRDHGTTGRQWGVVALRDER